MPPLCGHRSGILRPGDHITASRFGGSFQAGGLPNGGECCSLGKSMPGAIFRLGFFRRSQPAKPPSLCQDQGECEEALRRMQFQRLSIFRPGLLLGQRTASRPAEALARWTYPLWDWALPRSAASVHAQTVACAMLLDSLKEDQGEDIFDSQQIKILAKLLPR